MISYIKGDVSFIGQDYIVLENNNIGYKIYVTRKDIENINIHEDRKIYTEFIVKEDGIYLYGFLDNKDLDMFLLLTSVSSVGPKAALSILSTMETVEIKKAIATNDIKTITNAPGIGKKTASRIILDLSDKVDIESIIVNKENNLVVEAKIDSKKYEFALEALVQLGYSKQLASKALSSVDIENMDLSQVIKQALKEI